MLGSCRCIRRLLLLKVTNLIIWTRLEKLLWMSNVCFQAWPSTLHTLQRHTRTHTHYTWTVQPVIFLSFSPSAFLSLCAISLLSLLRISLSLSFSCSAALRNQLFCIYFIEIFLIIFPPLHSHFPFHFGLLLKISPNIFDVYFRLRLEKIFSFWGFFGVGGLMIEWLRQQSGWLGIRKQQSAPSSPYFNTVLQGEAVNTRGRCGSRRFPSELIVRAASAASWWPFIVNSCLWLWVRQWNLFVKRADFFFCSFSSPLKKEQQPFFTQTQFAPPHTLFVML